MASNHRLVSYSDYADDRILLLDPASDLLDQYIEKEVVRDFLDLYEMSALKTPVLSIVISEGGSGGALALAVADEVWMMQNAIYSILSPEGFASILWKDGKRAPEAAEVMKLTAGDLKKLGIVEEIVEEPGEFTVDTMPVVCEELRGKILRFLEKYEKMDGEELVEERYRRFRDM